MSRVHSHFGVVGIASSNSQPQLKFSIMVDENSIAKKRTTMNYHIDQRGKRFEVVFTQPKIRFFQIRIIRSNSITPFIEPSNCKWEKKRNDRENILDLWAIVDFSLCNSSSFPEFHRTRQWIVHCVRVSSSKSYSKGGGSQSVDSYRAGEMCLKTQLLQSAKHDWDSQSAMRNEPARVSKRHTIFWISIQSIGGRVRDNSRAFL